MSFKGRTFLRFESSKLSDYVSYYKNINLRFIALDVMRGFEEDNLSCLEGLYIEGIELNTMRVKDYSELLQHEELRYLVLSEASMTPIDFKRLPNLEVFAGEWSPNYTNLSSLKHLKELRLWKYKSPTRDLNEFGDLKNLEELHIVQSNIKTCNGIEHLKGLKQIHLAYNLYLEKFLDNKRPDFELEELEIQVCKKLDLDTLHGVRGLKSLEIINNGKMETLEPLLKKMPVLERLAFLQSELTNGNNLYFLKFPALQEVSIMDKRHYLLNSSEIDEGLKDSTKRKILLSKYR